MADGPPGDATLKVPYRASGRYLIRSGSAASAPSRRRLSSYACEVALEPLDVAVAPERQNVGREAVEEPAVVAHDHGAAGDFDGDTRVVRLRTWGCHLRTDAARGVF
jgi:hypothetical protein